MNGYIISRFYPDINPDRWRYWDDSTITEKGEASVAAGR